MSPSHDSSAHTVAANNRLLPKLTKQVWGAVIGMPREGRVVGGGAGEDSINESLQFTGTHGDRVHLPPPC